MPYSFIGLCNYYRKFMKNFSQIARPLHDVTKKEGFDWSDKQENSLISLKEKLTKPPVLTHFNPNKECELHVDVSRTGIGAIMLQESDDKNYTLMYTQVEVLPKQKKIIPSLNSKV